VSEGRKTDERNYLAERKKLVEGRRRVCFVREERTRCVERGGRLGGGGGGGGRVGGRLLWVARGCYGSLPGRCEDIWGWRKWRRGSGGQGSSS